jgi:hypothetical protein
MNQRPIGKELVLVYNADSGVFNALADAVHKIWSPETYNCQLCALTYGAVTMRDEWAKFLNELEIPVRFLHRDEFERGFPDLKTELPVILSNEGTRAEILLTAATINQCNTLNELKDALRRAASKTTS